MKGVGISIVAALALLLCGRTVCAQVVVDRAIIHLKTGSRPIENVVVRNSGNETLYITATPEEVLDPGTPRESRTENGKLIVSPKRFSLEAGGQRTVRLLLKESYGEREQVYRVKFLPEARGFARDQSNEIQGRKTLLKVLSGMGILLLVDPKTPAPQVRWMRDGDSLVIENNGNVNHFLSDGKVCGAPGSSCSEVTGARLYPGNTLRVKAPSGAQVSFKKETLEEFEDLVIIPAE